MLIKKSHYVDLLPQMGIGPDRNEVIQLVLRYMLYFYAVLSRL